MGDSTHDDGWVTDPDAIDTIIALDGLKPGDELRLNSLVEDIDLDAYEYEGNVVVVANAGDRASKHSSIYGPDRHGKQVDEHIVCTTQCNAVLTRHVIAAWRRPHA